jgi:hypothetical protein
MSLMAVTVSRRFMAHYPLNGAYPSCGLDAALLLALLSTSDHPTGRFWRFLLVSFTSIHNLRQAIGNFTYLLYSLTGFNTSTFPY